MTPLLATVQKNTVAYFSPFVRSLRKRFMCAIPSSIETALSAVSIEDGMAHMNRFLSDRTKGEKYATVFFCTVASNGVMRWANAAHPKRSEERRVGKECRSRWWPY